MAIGEWYHFFTRGVDKRKVFIHPKDYERFLVHLFVANGTKNVRISDLYDTSLASVLSNPRIERGNPLVEIGAYALMPSHPHLLIKEIRQKGTALFMQKVLTGYTMYFNNKYGRTGALFSGTFKSKHVHDDRYLKQVLPYILLNPVELTNPYWKNGRGEINAVATELVSYPYSSAKDFSPDRTSQDQIVSTDWSFYYDKQPTLKEMITGAQAYYQSLSSTLPQV